MNERIRKLIEKATKIVEPNDPDYRHEIFDKEKFAELIVKECIDQFCNRGAVSADGDIVIGVLEHFGVEE